MRDPHTAIAGTVNDGKYVHSFRDHFNRPRAELYNVLDDPGIGAALV
jgi:hypothetical protein